MSYPNLSAPLICQVEITTACSHNCFHCYNFWRDENNLTKSENRTLTVNEARVIVQKLVSAQVFDITFTGGEPLIAFDTLVSCIRQACAGGVGVHLNSNLLLLTANKAKELRESGLKSIVTSIMGPNAETYNTIAQNPGAFDRVVRNIKIAQDAGLAIVANMVVTKLNMSQVKETARFVYSLGVRKFSATKASTPGNCSDFSQYALTMEEFRKYLLDLSEVGAELGIKVDALEAYPLCGVKDLGIHLFAKNRRCMAGINSMTVGSNGLVRPCSHFDKSYGNLLTEDLHTIWGRMSEWKAGTFLPIGCKSCKLLGVCGGGCRMEAKVCCGDVAASDPYCVPADTEFALDSLKEYFETHQGEKAMLSDNDKFIILPYRARKESFGATVRSEGRPYAFLNKSGTDIFLQMQIGVPYQVGDLRVQWGTVDQLKFLNGLIDRGLAQLTEAP